MKVYCQNSSLICHLGSITSIPNLMFASFLLTAAPNNFLQVKCGPPSLEMFLCGPQTGLSLRPQFKMKIFYRVSVMRILLFIF
jgi:hypothetical protein